MSKVVIDCFPESVERWRDGYAIVAIDVVRATTTAITAVALGRRCFLARDVGHAWSVAATLDHPLMTGEVRGIMPEEFDINNSPSALVARRDIERPAVLVSSTGTRLCLAAADCVGVYLACLRNYRAVARHVAGKYSRVAVIGAGSGHEFREEDQMCCAWIADALMGFGFAPLDGATRRYIARWRGLPSDAWRGGKSEAYLRTSGQLGDLHFVIDHINDLDTVYALHGGEVVQEFLDARARKGELGFVSQ
jgi:2-phosphosulfolactate phosphatase